jgi:hypothetical protein
VHNKQRPEPPTRAEEVKRRRGSRRQKVFDARVGWTRGEYEEGALGGKQNNNNNIAPCSRRNTTLLCSTIYGRATRPVRIHVTPCIPRSGGKSDQHSTVTCPPEEGTTRDSSSSTTSRGYSLCQWRLSRAQLYVALTIWCITCYSLALSIFAVQIYLVVVGSARQTKPKSKDTRGKYSR